MIHSIPRYVVSTKIHEGSRTVVYRGRRETDGRPVVLKCTKPELPRQIDIARLRHEHAVLSTADAPNLLETFGLERIGNGLALVLEAFDGVPLRQLIRNGEAPLELVLEVAIDVCTTLSALHRKHIVHKDIKPDNILRDPAARRTVLIDFGLATWLTRESQRSLAVAGFEGSLAYMAPEQTGRMNRMIDHRSDLYSLGCTLYEALTGRPPFIATEPLEYVHSHIARVPPPPHRIAPDVPSVVSDIVMRLLAKTPEDRYQHAQGLKADLERALAALRDTGTIAPFALGSADLSDDLTIPQKLYGREAELERLELAFERVRHGAVELFVVSGYAGVGKSALVAELHKSVAAAGGYFVTGKLDQLASSKPYAAVAQAFGGLIRHVLADSPDSRAAWAARLTEVLGANGRVVADLAPELEELLGPQPPLEPLGPTEAQNRFSLVVQDFLRVFTADGKPVVLFLDDLQWADAASLKLLRLLLTDAENRHLLVIGTYRDNEVDEGHPLTLGLEELRKSDTPIEMIAVKPLELGSVTALVSDALESDAGHVAPLSALIFEKSYGNPFFVTQLLASLHEDGLLGFDRSAGEWRWDLEAIRGATIADSVVDFMTQRLGRMSASSQHVLQLAACIGHEFDLATLARVAAKSPYQTAQALWEPLREGHVLPLDPEYRFLYAGADGGAADDLGEESVRVSFRFLHDRAQQAAYRLVPEEERPMLHLRVGRLLNEAHGGEPDGEDLFRIVNHLNTAVDHITDPDERRRLAHLNIRAGRYAKQAAAHDAATQYLGAAMACLDEAEWERSFELLLDVTIDRAESEFLVGNKSGAIALFDAAYERGRDARERARVLNQRIVLHTVFGEYPEAQEVGRRTLALFGVELPSLEQAPAALGEELGRVPQHLGDRRIEDLAHAPVMEDPDQRMIQTVLTSMLPSSFMTNPFLYAFVITRCVNIALQHGMSATAITGVVSLGYFQAGVLGQYEDAYKWGRLAMDLTERFGVTDVRAKLFFLFGCYNHFYEPADTALKVLAQGRQYGFEVGDFQYLSYTTYCSFMIRLGRGDPLPEVGEEVRRFLALMRRTQDALSTAFLQVSVQIAANLEGRTKSPVDLSDDGFDEAAFEAVLQEHGNYFVSCYLWTYKAQLCYQQRRLTEALAYADRAEANIGSGAGLFFTTELVLFACLILTALADECPEDERPARDERLARLHGQLATWAERCPSTYEAKRLLVAAERARIEGRELDAMRLYDDAIAAARASEFVRDEALAYELAGRFHLAAGRARIGRTYLVDARYAYARWNVPTKLAQLAEELPFLDEDEPSVSLFPGADSRGSSASSYTEGDALDVKTVMDVASAISGELRLDRLLERLMRTLIENAGAQRAALLLDREGRLQVEARITIDPDEVRVATEPLETVSDLPRSVIRHVSRTRQPVVLGNALADPDFGSDPWFQRAGTRSVSCVPMLHQGRLAGVLYLENSAARDVFTPARNQLLEVLSSQAAVAVENATLYSDLQAASAELSKVNASLERQVADRTRELEQAMAEIWSEMDLAKKIQTVLLPREPAMRGYDVAASMRPASTVGGDYFDVIRAHGCDWVLVGDVSGHGVPAGLIMMMVQTAVRTAVQSSGPDLRPSRLLSIVNGAITPNLEKIGKGQYMTITALRFDGDRLTYSGLHEDILVYRAGRQALERVETHGAWVGVLEDLEGTLRDDELRLDTGDTLLLFSDGVTEARLDGAFLGSEGLGAMFRELVERPSCEDIVGGIEERLSAYATHDDVTLLAIRRTEPFDG